jgi:hypothetical protein
MTCPIFFCANNSCCTCAGPEPCYYAQVQSWRHSLSCMAEMNQGHGKALRELLFKMLKMMLKAYLRTQQQQRRRRRQQQ